MMKAVLAHMRMPAYALLVPVFPVLCIYAGNLSRLSPGHAITSALIITAIYLAVRLALHLLFKGHELVDPILAIVFVAVFVADLFLPQHAYLPAWLAVWTALGFIIVKWREPRRIFANIAAIFIAILMINPVMKIYSSPLWAKRAEIAALADKAFPPLPQAARAPAEKRDIYYLIFDRYARADQLQAIYGYDNSAFIAELRKRGFDVGDEAYANYQRTTHSVISSLNFDYLDALDVPQSAHSGDWIPLYQMLQDTRISRFLKGQGYTFEFFGTWWEPTRYNATADANYNWYSAPEALRAIYEGSLAVDVARLIGLRALDPLWMQCQRSHRMFETLSTQTSAEKPRFVFAHFLVPHPPFVMDATGRCMDVAEASARSRAENYTGQVTFTNNAILDFIDARLAAPGPKPIIILQSDEGPWPKRFAGDEVARLGRDVSNVQWTKASEAELKEKMAIFSAIYFPDADEAVFPADRTPVNTFRTVLNREFGTSLPLLPNRYFVFQDNGNLYRFHEVTGKLAGPGPTAALK